MSRIPLASKVTFMQKTQHSIDKQRQALDGLQQAALAWWEGRRPQGWQLTEHLSSPAVNTSNPAEEALARGIAAAVACGAL